MSEPPAMLPTKAEPPRPRGRLRRFLILAACVGFVLIAAPLAFYIWASSAATENLVRRSMVEWLEQATGGRVEIASFHWRLLSLEADAGGVVIHGREARGEAPVAQAAHVSASFTLFGLWSPRVLLRNLEIDKPAFHVIVYPDGSTNLPQPKRPAKSKKPVLDSLFDLEAGHVLVQQGVLNYENRAASFDFQNRFELVDVDARDVSLVLAYAPPNGTAPEAYHIQTGAKDLSLVRGKARPMPGAVEATIDLTRSAAYLRSLRITSSVLTGKKHEAESHTCEITGELKDFAHPNWVARATGELDLRLMDPVLGYPFTPQGIAHLDLNAAGEGGEFRTDGTIHAVNAAYVGTGVNATGVLLDAHVHADPRRLLISNIVARLRQGGQLSGEVDLQSWLPPMPAAVTLDRPGASLVKVGPPGHPAFRARSRRDPDSGQRQGHSAVYGCKSGRGTGHGEPATIPASRAGYAAEWIGDR